ncbi:hypothetical protein ACL9RI_26725 [Janthinobacterium sp. Mn2066]|uniref:hypothetical protein n=1 Tax=Janthinobacterium sp. Mn2066 TaxID=3395264 RepID=UPI003BDC8AE6
MKRIILSVVATLFLCGSAFAGGPNSNIKYYGYDWLDFYQGGNPPYSATDALNIISGTGFSTTNLNVVHTIENLNSSACIGNKCAISINAGSGSPGGSPILDICPGAVNNTQCQSMGSWSNIWRIAFNIGTSSNIPSAIYFIDEPFGNPALQSNQTYVQYQYASYVCTLRQAMKAYGLNMPIYTVLSYGQSKDVNNVKEVQNGAPISACPTTDKSSPDWIGIDNYNWSVADMWISYNRVAPANNPNSQKWVLVPPSTPIGMTDQQLHDQIQLYWDFINNYKNSPVIYVMNWRFDTAVTLNRNNYPKSSALLSFMANTITSQ